MISVATMSDTEVVARTLWAEARNQREAGMEAVASVILNRAAQPSWWGSTPREVCLAPQQFSCWNASDPQSKIIRSEVIYDRMFPLAQVIAHEALTGRLRDTVNGADHYCTEAVAPQTRWTHGHTPVAKVGTHLFYRIGPSG